MVRLRRLIVDNCPRNEVVNLSNSLGLHPSLTELRFENSSLDTPADMDALVDAAIDHGVTCLSFRNCKLGPPLAAHLVHLMRDAPRLSALGFFGDQLFNATSTPALTAALRASTLSVLFLESVLGQWCVDNGLWTAVVNALVGHPTIQQLSLSHNNRVEDRAAFGACLARLISANTPTLNTLSLAWCAIPDDGLRSILAAVANNTYLQALFLHYNRVLSADFAEAVVLPAVRANSALRTLTLTPNIGSGFLGLFEAQELVAARR